MKKLWMLALLLLPLWARATVTGTASTVSFSCSNSTGPFAFTFPVDDVGGLLVIDIPSGSLPGVMTIMPTSTWTASPVNQSYANGGTVTLNNPCTSGDTLVIARSTEATQLTHYTQFMPALYANFENGLDQLTTGRQDTFRVDQVYPGVMTTNAGTTGSASITYTPLGQYLNITFPVGLAVPGTGTTPHLLGWNNQQGSADALTAQINGNLIGGPNISGQFGSNQTALSNSYLVSTTDSTSSTNAKSGSALDFISGGVGAYATSTGLISTVKSDRSSLQIGSLFNTPAQNVVINSESRYSSGGEAGSFWCEEIIDSGWEGPGQEANECLRIEMKQFNGTVAASGGVTGFTAGTFTPAASSTTVPVNSFSANQLDFAGDPWRSIRSLGNTISGTYSAVNCSSAGSPSYSSCAITVSNLTGFITSFSNPITTYNCAASGSDASGSPWCGGQPIAEKACITPAPALGTNNAQPCIPITSYSTGSSTVTVDLRQVGTAQNTTWPANWATNGNYVIYGAAAPNKVTCSNNLFVGGVCSGTQSFVTADSSGLISGDSMDQVESYSQTFGSIQLLATPTMGMNNTSGWLANLESLGTTSAPQIAVGIAVSGYLGDAYEIGNSHPCTGCVPSVGYHATTNPSRSFSGSDDQSGSNSTFFYNRDSSGGTYYAIGFNKATPGSPIMCLFCNSTSTTGAWLLDTSGDTTQTGNLTAQNGTLNNLNVSGTFASANLATGPAANQILDSQFPTGSTGGSPWTESGSGVSWTNNGGTDIFGNTTALEANVPASGTAQVLQMTSITMSTSGVYSVSFYVLGPAGSNATINLNTSGSDTGCAAGGGAGIPSSIPTTGVIQKFTVYCTPNISDTMKVALHVGNADVSNAHNFFFSTAQIAGTPYCNPTSGGCTTTGPPLITTSGALTAAIGSVIVSGTTQPSGESVIAFTATPTFSASAQLNTMTLTGNVTGSTLAAGNAGQAERFVICQDGSGSHTFVWPTNVHGGMTIGSTASKCNAQDFVYSANQSLWFATGAGVTNE